MHRSVSLMIAGGVLLLVFNLAFPTGVVPAASMQEIRPQGTFTPTQALYLPVVVNAPPTIVFTTVPAYGTSENLQGRVEGVTPAGYQVAVFIFVSGWWNKPTWAQPLTTIRSDGAWTADITTGSGDEAATRIAAFLVPAGYAPPSMAGGATLPAGLYDAAAAYLVVDRAMAGRTIDFSGYTWVVKASDKLVGPGPNYFSDATDDVWVDSNGRLHLTVGYRGGKWVCTEVVSVEPFGYGTYTFTLASRVDLIDKNAVLGLFTWDDAAPEYHYREIDVECSRWAEESAANTQYVVQPWDTAGNRYRFDTVLAEDDSTHRFTWTAGDVSFASCQGHGPTLGETIQTWTYTGADVPPAGSGNARMNLWLADGAAPSDGQGIEVVIEAFEFSAP